MIYNRIFKGLFKIILNSPSFLVRIYIFKCHDIKDIEICNPMESFS